MGLKKDTEKKLQLEEHLAIMEDREKELTRLLAQQLSKIRDLEVDKKAAIEFKDLKILSAEKSLEEMKTEMKRKLKELQSAEKQVRQECNEIRELLDEAKKAYVTPLPKSTTTS